MSQANVIDFVPRSAHEPIVDDGTVLGVIPVPGTDSALVIVSHLVSAPRTEPRAEPELPPRRRDDLEIDRDTRTVRLDGVSVELTYREFELLDYLAAAPGRVYNRKQLMAAVWDRYGDDNARTIDVHILRLRRKLGRHAERIITVRNVGYKYQAPPR
ncbi:hypothetical protein Aple_018470 [Acrocarpospora pleiomorpha]|uniref:OmpR/PhoB-type domain-containing protein n=1 Tax=Acrocarpospora pleiomorpha TaxID=90975 RepID=A0A5M3XDV2_9ACTN|nr:winged helix-turn-helix domain-containing protein [Acrocarpospora pleiomorpha]GES18952.1 hypothetical protein Aple_018470 [Acrocarpospora pleiomorpha]